MHALAHFRFDPRATLALLACIVCGSGCGAERTVYAGGPILTLNANDEIVEAVGLEGERIAAVGTRAEVLEWADGGARVVELNGKAMLPGFIDAHGHFPGEGIYSKVVDLNAPPIGDVEKLDDLIELLTQRAGETPAGDWILGMSYDDTLLAEGRHPTRHDLDRVSTQHPIAITTCRATSPW